MRRAVSVAAATWCGSSARALLVPSLPAGSAAAAVLFRAPVAGFVREEVRLPGLSGSIVWEPATTLESIGEAMGEHEAMQCDNLIRKRRRKMNKHKHSKMLKKQRFLRRKLGK